MHIDLSMNIYSLKRHDMKSFKVLLLFIILIFFLTLGDTL